MLWCSYFLRFFVIYFQKLGFSSIWVDPSLADIVRENRWKQNTLTTKKPIENLAWHMKKRHEISHDKTHSNLWLPHENICFIWENVATWKINMKTTTWKPPETLCFQRVKSCKSYKPSVHASLKNLANRMRLAKRFWFKTPRYALESCSKVFDIQQI